MTSNILLTWDLNHLSQQDEMRMWTNIQQKGEKTIQPNDIKNFWTTSTQNQIMKRMREWNTRPAAQKLIDFIREFLIKKISKHNFKYNQRNARKAVEKTGKLQNFRFFSKFWSRTKKILTQPAYSHPHIELKVRGTGEAAHSERNYT